MPADGRPPLKRSLVGSAPTGRSKPDSDRHRHWVRPSQSEQTGGAGPPSGTKPSMAAEARPSLKRPCAGSTPAEGALPLLGHAGRGIHDPRGHQECGDRVPSTQPPQREAAWLQRRSRSGAATEPGAGDAAHAASCTKTPASAGDATTTCWRCWMCMPSMCGWRMHHVRQPCASSSRRSARRASWASSAADTLSTHGGCPASSPAPHSAAGLLLF